MELLKQKLYKNMKLYGFTDPKTVRISEILDKKINKVQRRIIYEC